MIDEIRRIRASISAEHGNNVDLLCSHLREVQRRYADRLVRRPAATTAGKKDQS